MPLDDARLRAWLGQIAMGMSARRRSALKWLEYYQGDQVRHVPKNRDEDQDHFDKRPKCTLNITRRIVDAKSCLYSEGCLRDTADPDVKRFWLEVDIDQRMREADPIARLCGTFFVFPDFVVPAKSFWGAIKGWFFSLTGADPAQDGRYIWRAYPSHLVEVLLDDDYPEIPAALAIVSGGRAVADPVAIQVWTAERYYRFEAPSGADAVGKLAAGPAAAPLEGEPHRFGRIPLAALRNEPDWTRDFWGRAEAPNVVPQNEEINRLVSSLQWLVINQSHGQVVAHNPPNDFKPRFGTDQIVKIYDDPATPELKGSIEILAPVANAEGLKNTIDWNLDKVCEVNDVPAGTYRLDVNRQSGSSLVEKRVATFEYRKRRRPQALGWERELAALARIVKAVRTGQPIPAGVPQISVDWREPEMPQQVQDRVQREQHELATAQATGPELLMRHNPDMTWDQAVEEYEFNLAFNREHAAASAEFSLDAGGAPASPEAREQAQAAIDAAGEGGASGAAARQTDAVFSFGGE